MRVILVLVFILVILVFLGRIGAWDRAKSGELTDTIGSAFAPFLSTSTRSAFGTAFSTSTFPVPFGK